MSERRRRRGSAAAGAVVALLGWAATACEPPPPPSPPQPEYVEMTLHVADTGVAAFEDVPGGRIVETSRPRLDTSSNQELEPWCEVTIVSDDLEYRFEERPDPEYPWDPFRGTSQWVLTGGEFRVRVRNASRPHRQCVDHKQLDLFILADFETWDGQTDDVGSLFAAKGGLAEWILFAKITHVK